MARRKTTPEHDPIHDVYVLQDDGEEDDEEVLEDDSTAIETQAFVDWIEYDPDDEEETRSNKTRSCRMTFHVDLPEHVAQHLFANHVRDGRLTIEFQPLDPELRRRDSFVHS